MLVAADEFVTPEPARSPKFVAVPRLMGTIAPLGRAAAVANSTRTARARAVILIFFKIKLLKRA
jgi:hypothetical protein